MTSERSYEASLALFDEALELIPGGTQTNSKRPGAFAWGAYPIYLASGQGGHVTDIDGNTYIDLVSGLGPVSLGYAYPAVDAAIRAQLGLDRPLPIQFFNYVKELARGNLGQSLTYKQPVLDIILSRLPATLLLTVTSAVIALVIGTAWRWSLHRVVTRELQHEREADRAAIAASITESATSAARLELAEIRAEVSPVLIRLRDGAVLDDAQVQEVAIVEAEVRDRIRSPRLRHERLRTAIASARRRGVHIVLLGSADASGDVIGDDLAAAVALLTDAIDRGSITIRAVPPGRTGALSVLLDAGDRSERLLFDDAGVVIARS